MNMNISAYYANHFRDYGIAHAAYNIVKHMQSDSHRTTLHGLSSDKMFASDFYADFIPRWSMGLVYRAFSHQQILQYGESRFLRFLDQSQSDIAYLWPGLSLDMFKQVHKRGYKIIFEGVNTHEANSKKILDEAYRHLNLPATHSITHHKINEESEKLALSDYIYSCSPIMSESYTRNGVDATKIMPTSYGLSQQFILPDNDKPSSDSSCVPVFLFVGSIDVRKGVPKLLEYWTNAKLPAKLKLVGKIDPAIEPIVQKYLAADTSIEHIAFTMNLTAIYEEADVFVLPSLEEGSPLVTYLAMGAGLPVLASPMGAGGVVTHGVEGLVLDAYAEANWIEALRKLSEDAVYRQSLASNTKAKAKQYTWDLVGQRRLASLIKIHQ